MKHRAEFFEAQPEFRFWIGPDMKMEEGMTIEPNGQHVGVPVAVTKESLPAYETISPWLSYSVRSTLAQLGLETAIGLDRMRDERMWDELQTNGRSTMTVDVVNYGYRGIRLEPGDDLFRFYLRSREGRYEGKALADHVREHELVKGTYGEDWWFLGRNAERLPHDEPDGSVMVRLPYDPEKRLWVPPDQAPIRLVRRADLEDHIVPMPPNMDPDFFVGETRAAVQMAERPGLLLTTFGDETSHDVRQTQSNLIDPNFGRPAGGKPIRIEILDPVNKSHHLPYVDMELWPAIGEGK